MSEQPSGHVSVEELRDLAREALHLIGSDDTAALTRFQNHKAAIKARLDIEPNFEGGKTN